MNAIGEEGSVVNSIVDGGDTNSYTTQNFLEMNVSQAQASNENDDGLFEQLCHACRVGDYEAVDRLVSILTFYLNQVDEWDNSPLILLSICGHFEVVELLLARGARCDRDTFEGARCVYGALTDKIRNLLLSYDYSKSVSQSQPFASHIASFINSIDHLKVKDISFYFSEDEMKNNVSFRLHRFLMAVRSVYCRQKLFGDWENEVFIDMSMQSDPLTFKSIVDYIYLRPETIPFEDTKLVKKLDLLARKYSLDNLVDAIEELEDESNSKYISKFKTQFSIKCIENARLHFSNFLNQCILPNKIQTYIELDEDIELEDINVHGYITDDQKDQLFKCSAVPDIILVCIDIESESVVYYPANKVILSRSEYFDTMFKSEMFQASQYEIPISKDESKTANIEITNRPKYNPRELPVLNLCVGSQEVIELLLGYLYHDDVVKLTLSNTIPLLYAADEFLLDRLKTMCCMEIIASFYKFSWEEFQSVKEHIGYDVYDLVRISWGTRCDKLLQHVTKMIAYNLKKVCLLAEHRRALLSLITESAGKIKDRHETDTIELVDEIRFYLRKKYSVGDNFQDLPSIGKLMGTSDEADDIKVLKLAFAQFQLDTGLIDSLLEESDLSVRKRDLINEMLE